MVCAVQTDNAETLTFFADFLFVSGLFYSPRFWVLGSRFLCLLSFFVVRLAGQVDKPVFASATLLGLILGAQSSLFCPCSCCLTLAN